MVTATQTPNTITTNIIISNGQASQEKIATTAAKRANTSKLYHNQPVEWKQLREKEKKKQQCMKKHEEMENRTTGRTRKRVGKRERKREGEKNMFSFVFAIYLYYSCARPLVKFTLESIERRMGDEQKRINEPMERPNTYQRGGEHRQWI